MIPDEATRNEVMRALASLGPAVEQAKADGLPTMSVSEAAAAGDIICLLIPDEVQQQEVVGMIGAIPQCPVGQQQNMLA